MTRKRTPSPGIAGELAGGAIISSVIAGIFLPVIQHFMWMLLVEIPATLDHLSQPSWAWMYILIIGLLPILLFVAGILQATTAGGLVGGTAYFIMVIVAQQLFNQPVLTVTLILGITFVTALYIALRITTSGRRRRYH